MEKKQLAREIFMTSHLTGRFVLRSGQISGEYFDKYQFESDPALLREIALRMAELVPAGTEILAGLETGGIPLATMISQVLGLPAVFVRKKAKEYGTCKLAEGADFKGKKVCVVEDVVTTGGQIIKSADDLRKAGAHIDSVLCVILRDEKGRANLSADSLTLFPLFTMEELKNEA